MFIASHWGKGYGTESVVAMVEFARTSPFLPKPCLLQAYINPANPPSARVIEKSGFELAEKICRPDEPKVWVGGAWREYDVWRFVKKVE